MTAPNDTPKVVDLSKRQVLPGANDRMGDLLKLVRGISQKRINGLVSTLFENVDDALFDLAERAGSNAIQTEYFDELALLAHLAHEAPARRARVPGSGREEFRRVRRRQAQG